MFITKYFKLAGYSSSIAILLLVVADGAHASKYGSEAGINYLSTATTLSDQHFRRAQLSADYTVNFAPTFVSGPVTQHAYSQKVSQLTIKTDHVISSSNDEESSVSGNALSLNLYPPGHSYYFQVDYADNTINASSRQQRLKQTSLGMGFFTSGKFSYGVRASDANTGSFTDIDQIYQYAGRARGVFVKNIVRSLQNTYLMYTFSLSTGRFDLSNTLALDYRQGSTEFALYPNKSEEWALSYTQYRIEDEPEKRDESLLSYTNYISKNNGLIVKLKRDQSYNSELRSISLGWKIRI